MSAPGPPAWRSGRRSRWRRRRRARRGACARPCPDGPRSCGSMVDAHALAGGELVGVHRQAHRAARFAPVEPGVDEDRSRPSASACAFTAIEPGHDQRAHAVADLAARATTAAAARRSSMREFVHDPMNTRVDRDVAHRRARPSGPCSRSARVATRARTGRRTSRGRARRRRSSTSGRGSCPSVT